MESRRLAIAVLLFICISFVAHSAAVPALKADIEENKRALTWTTVHSGHGYDRICKWKLYFRVDKEVIFPTIEKERTNCYDKRRIIPMRIG